MSKENPAHISIVIAAWNGSLALRDCLNSIEKQTVIEGVEVIAVTNFSIEFDDPGFSFNLSTINAPEKSTVPELRAIGIGAAEYEIIAIIEDHCICDKEWVANLRMAFTEERTIVGGAVENAETVKSALDWAVYFYDYGKFMLPIPSGPAFSLSGLNTAYRKKALNEVADFCDDGFFETFINKELENRGNVLWLEPSVVVYHSKSYTFRKAAAHCFHLARSFAGRRGENSSLLMKLILPVGALALPILLPARIIASTFQKKRNMGQLVRALPYIVLLMLIWSIGEFIGYIFGEGTSGNYWK